jgi:hypothetical protein
LSFRADAQVQGDIPRFETYAPRAHYVQQDASFDKGLRTLTAEQNRTFSSRFLTAIQLFVVVLPLSRQAKTKESAHCRLPTEFFSVSSRGLARSLRQITGSVIRQLFPRVENESNMMQTVLSLVDTE